MGFAILLDYQRREGGETEVTGEVVWDGDGLIPILQQGDWLGCPPVATITAPGRNGVPDSYHLNPAPGGPLIGMDMVDALTPGEILDALFRHTGSAVSLFLNGKPAALEPAGN